MQGLGFLTYVSPSPLTSRLGAKRPSNVLHFASGAIDMHYSALVRLPPWVYAAGCRLWISVGHKVTCKLFLTGEPGGLLSIIS